LCILKGLVDDKANSAGDNSIAFNVATATSDNNAVNKGQLDTELALKPNSTSVTNEINTRIANEFTARNNRSLAFEHMILASYQLSRQIHGNYYLQWNTTYQGRLKVWFLLLETQDLICLPLDLKLN
jgi:hypothetical protein